MLLAVNDYKYANELLALKVRLFIMCERVCLCVVDFKWLLLHIISIHEEFVRQKSIWFISSKPLKRCFFFLFTSLLFV